MGAWQRIQIGAENAFDHGSKSGITTAAVPIVATKTICKRGVQVKADSANAGIVYIGNSDVTNGSADATDGFPLSAGQGLFVPAQDAATVYVVASAATQKVYWFTV